VKTSSDTHDREKPDRPDDQSRKAEWAESDIDQILADSFPASDAPPWTLGVTPETSTDSGTRGRSRRAGR
jgi:hypothetical protein